MQGSCLGCGDVGSSQILDCEHVRLLELDLLALASCTLHLEWFKSLHMLSVK